MRRLFVALAAVLSFVGFDTRDASADTTVKLTEMHICCGGCKAGIKKAVKDVTGATVDVDQDNEEVTIKAESKEAAQKAVDAIVSAGYHAKVASGDATIKDDSGAPSGKVKKLIVSNAHNCCGACAKAIKGALKTVDGVASDDCQGKKSEFTVEGDFDAKAVVAALEKAGFHVYVKK
jgi:copper chaperone CopZ